MFVDFQYWFIVNWAYENKLQWNFDQNAMILMHKSELYNGVCKVTAMLFRP